MSNGPDARGHVTRVQQRDDDTLLVYVETGSFSPGQEVEVSVYLSQGDAYAAHNEKKYIPFPDNPNNSKQPAELHVELPGTQLDPGQDLMVLTRVAEVWPSVLQQDSTAGTIDPYTNQGPKAVWTYKEPAGKVSGYPGPSPTSDGGN